MISFQSVSKKYPNGTHALENVTLEVGDNEFIFITGASGAGKSTLLKLLIRDEKPTDGQIFVDDWEVTALPKSNIPHLRRRIGTIFQDFKLLPKKTVFENVAFALEILGADNQTVATETLATLELFNLHPKQDLFPWQLSGGEAQRTAIARAFVLKPEIILADEPTGNLDPKSAWEVMHELTKLNNLGATIIMATHNLDYIKNMGHRVVELEEGKITKDHKAAHKAD